LRVEVVAQLTRRRQRRLIGQDRRPGEVVRQPDAGDCPRLRAAETGEIEGCLDQPLMGDQRNLMGKLEGVGGGVAFRRQGQNPCLRVVAPHRLAGEFGGHAVSGLQPGDPGGQLVAALEPGAAGELLGGPVDRVDIVVAVVKEVAHLLPGQRCQPARRAMNGVGQPRRVGGDDLQFGAAVRRVAEHRVGQGLAQIGHQPVALVHREYRDIDAETLGQPQHHIAAYGAVVVLHLVEIAQGYRQFPGKGGLGQAQPAADFAQPGAGVDFACRHAHAS
jgi:hypothetical protein